MKPNKLLTSGICLLALVFLFSISPALGQDKVLKLNYSTFMPAVHKQSMQYAEWSKEIEKRTEGIEEKKDKEWDTKNRYWKKERKKEGKKEKEWEGEGKQNKKYRRAKGERSKHVKKKLIRKYTNKRNIVRKRVNKGTEWGGEK